VQIAVACQRHQQPRCHGIEHFHIAIAGGLHQTDRGPIQKLQQCLVIVSSLLCHNLSLLMRPMSWNRGLSGIFNVSIRKFFDDVGFCQHLSAELLQKCKPDAPWPGGESPSFPPDQARTCQTWSDRAPGRRQVSRGSRKPHTTEGKSDFGVFLRNTFATATGYTDNADADVPGRTRRGGTCARAHADAPQAMKTKLTAWK
ncbi:hypothetical protein JK635_07095, partial [Neobacillus sp. YIM B02564]|nr:hypothetical protein [Neobacillus paridis]